jgi:protein-S-isoprenylcysteine O-methyltransferase
LILSAALAVGLGLFAISEATLAVLKRAPPESAVDDRGSMRLMQASGVLSVGLAVALQMMPYRTAPLPGSWIVVRLLALGLIVAGVCIRWAAVLALGRFFTMDVAIQAHQPVIETGPYRFIRHPAYAGLLLSFAGLGVYADSWLGLAVLLVPISAAVVNRIVREEAVLLATLGTPYAAYCARTKRLIPGLL